MSTIKVECVDQTLTITNAPVIASGGLLENDVEFDFCELWTGYVKTAVFYKDKNLVYSAAVGNDNKCSVPHEVTDDEGTMYFGVFGTNEDGVIKTSEIVKYRIVEGAITDDSHPSDPTPEFWQQCLTKITEAITASNNVVNTANTANQNSATALALAKTHASRHGANGEDPITPAAIGAAESNHTHKKNQITDFPSTMPPSAHSHGNIDSSGRCGNDMGKLLATGLNGVITAKTMVELGLKPTNVTDDTGTVSITLSNNRDYKFTGVTSLSFTKGTGECHGFVTFGTSTPVVTMNDFVKVDGDITSAKASEVWEFSAVDGYIVWKNWSDV